jgi:hypothetical protein
MSAHAKTADMKKKEFLKNDAKANEQLSLNAFNVLKFEL